LALCSETAVEELYERYATQAYRYARALGLRSTDAEDIVAESFLSIIEAQRAGGAYECTAGWVFTIVRNAAHNLNRWRNRQKKLLQAAQERQPVVMSAGAQAKLDGETIEKVEAALAELPDEQRSALALVVFAALSYREAAQAEGISEATLTSRLFRARQVLRRKLGDDCP
jgi:RNA polymerase sigma-70 factor (ECF subfamily)